jgi:hypothetical protein
MNITTDYEAFCYITEKLLEQNARSLREDGTCVYRGHTEDIIEKSRPVGIDPDYDEQLYFQMYEDNLSKFDYNLKCAVGHIISDDIYSPYIEEQTIENEPVFKAVLKSNPKWNMTENSIKLLKILQYIHDKEPVDSWKVDFDIVQNFFDEVGSYIGGTNMNILDMKMIEIEMFGKVK